MTVRRPRRRTREIIERASRDERRQQILAATRAVIDEHGLAKVTMDRVANEAKVSKPVVYRLFANRGEILVAMLEEFWDDLDARLVADADHRRSRVAFARSVTESYFEALTRGGRALQEVLSSGGEEPEVDAARQKRSARIEAIWSHYYERSLRLSPEMARAAAAIIRCAIAGAGEYWIKNPDVDRAACIEACVATIVGALKELSATAGRRTNASETKTAADNSS